MAASNKRITELTALNGSSFSDDDLLEASINTGAGWVSRKVTGLGMLYGTRQRVVIPISPADADATTGDGKNEIEDMFYGWKILNVGAFCSTAPTGSTASIQINVGGSDILSTPITIDATEKTSSTAATPAVISTNLTTKGQKIRFDLDQVGSSVAGQGYHVIIEYKLRKL